MQKNPKTNKRTNESGIAIYIAVTITAALVLVSFAIINVAIKQVSISGAARDSQAAFYAADSGVECALYWDLKQASFSTTTSASNIACNNQSIAQARTSSGGAATSTFTFFFTPNTYCAKVSVAKFYRNDELKTKIESRGYNSCDTQNTRRVERAILVNY